MYIRAGAGRRQVLGVIRGSERPIVGTEGQTQILCKCRVHSDTELSLPFQLSGVLAVTSLPTIVGQAYSNDHRLSQLL